MLVNVTQLFAIKVDSDRCICHAFSHEYLLSFGTGMYCAPVDKKAKDAQVALNDFQSLF